MSTEPQKITKAKGRPLLSWAGKKPLDKIEYYPAQEKEVYGDKKSKDFNKLFWGDNLQVLAHLLKENRGMVDLIYIDPPFASKADYVRKVKLKGEQIEGEQQSLLEDKQYTDIWLKDEYLQFMYERLQIMRELLSDTGSIFLHCDWHKGAYLKILMDEVFGEENFRNEIIWYYPDKFATGGKSLDKNHDTIYHYSKTNKFTGKNIRIDKDTITKRALRKKVNGKTIDVLDEEGKKIYAEYFDKRIDDVWEISRSISTNEYLSYPTQKKEDLVVRLLNYGSNENDLIMDCFCGSGTTLAVAQKLGRRWIGCDINLGAIQTTTKRLNQIISEQLKNNHKLIKDDFKGLHAFKVSNVNDYDIFKNDLEAKEIVMEMYGIEPIKRTYFDGTLDNNFVKVMPMNRVLNKLDIKTVLKNIEDKQDSFTVKKQSKANEATFEEGVLIICSGLELDCPDYLKKENKTGVKVEIKNILRDKKNLIFKKRCEAKIEVKLKGSKLLVAIKEFHSPILMRKIQIENEKSLKKEREAKVEDFRQIIDSVAIDVDYNGKLFNAEIMDIPTKKEVIKGDYGWDYKKAGKNIVAVKIVDVLGEEYFESFKV